MKTEGDLRQLAKESLLPMLLNQSGNHDDPIDEAIFCTSISGGGDYQNNMPRTLTLVRRFADGREFTAKYRQHPLDTEGD